MIHIWCVLFTLSTQVDSLRRAQVTMRETMSVWGAQVQDILLSLQRSQAETEDAEDTEGAEGGAAPSLCHRCHGEVTGAASPPAAIEGVEGVEGVEGGESVLAALSRVAKATGADDKGDTSDSLTRPNRLVKKRSSVLSNHRGVGSRAIGSPISTLQGPLPRVDSGLSTHSSRTNSGDDPSMWEPFIDDSSGYTYYYNRYDAYTCDYQRVCVCVCVCVCV